MTTRLPKIAYPRMLFDGFFVGILTGLVGVGGGFLIVPTLAMLVGLPMQAAVGTSLMIIGSLGIRMVNGSKKVTSHCKNNNMRIP